MLLLILSYLLSVNSLFLSNFVFILPLCLQTGAHVQAEDSGEVTPNREVCHPQSQALQSAVPGQAASAGAGKAAQKATGAVFD